MFSPKGRLADQYVRLSGMTDGRSSKGSIRQCDHGKDLTDITASEE
jgi:hypothetical protein